MTLLSTAQHIARDTRKNPRGHMVMIVVAAVLTVGAVALIAYLLWPTWGYVVRWQKHCSFTATTCWVY